MLYDVIFGIFGVDHCGREINGLVAWVSGVAASAITGVTGRFNDRVRD